MRDGFFCRRHPRLVSVVDLGRVSVTLAPESYPETFEMAVTRAGCRPEIMSTDQGSQFPSAGWIERMGPGGTRIRMEGQGRWTGEHRGGAVLWPLKHQDVYLRDYGASRLGRRASRRTSSGTTRGGGTRRSEGSRRNCVRRT